MAKYQKGQKLQIKEGIEKSQMGGFEVEIFQVDDTRKTPAYMVIYRDGAALGGYGTGIYFWMSEDDLEEIPDEAE